MKINFYHSPLREKERLVNIFSEYQWFIDHHFSIILPKFYARTYQQNKSNKNFFAKKLKRELDKIYNKNDYQLKQEKIKNNWQKIERQFFDILNTLNFKIKNRYICYISLYGPEGQFKYPNIINLRVSNKNDIQEANSTIVHEIMHLLIFSKAKSLKLNYKQIEGVVDLFFKRTSLKKIFPKYELQRGVVHDFGLFKKFL